MTAAQIAAALLALAGLLAIARARRVAEVRLSTPAEARARAEELLAGFEGRAALVGADGRAALVAGDGVVAVLHRRGLKLAAYRLLPPLDVVAAVEGVAVRTGTALGEVTLLGVIEPDVRAAEAQALQGGGTLHRLFPADD
ncbi:hypothetical protein DVW87_14830 [Sphingomonas aracearum]|uniref:Uncharacterized protein n=2 Tax=Sphingomonas aracearum TaxID=2283317 RepID=A0A369VYZ5_9SPHN|nr:hypothetical protein DVW87_14830 [Sphingomonas aracearum]